MDKVEQNLNSILKRYWGYDTFRAKQLEVIESIVNKQDTLALLPTAGGKSACFQVPAIHLDGVCLVVSPLIALMKDQVLQLKKRQIPAAALISGMSYREIDIALDNCRARKTKLLYISPERLQSEDMRTRLSNIPISFIAVDEAHCISQWGYNFRPSYLKISEFRELHPTVPVMALTATATPKVVIDIMDKLLFKKPLVFSKSFERKNIAYKVFFEESKWDRLVKIFSDFKGSGIIYTRNRKLTKSISDYLQRQNISIDFYHAGLSSEIRDAKQSAWTVGQTKIIVATNAFGMGIDKSDVRLVVHLHIPDNLESYFQESGRAGRNDSYAEAITLFEQKDVDDLMHRIDSQFPPKKFIKAVYTALGSFFQLAVGGGINESFEFDLEAFATRFNYNRFETYNALVILEKDEYLTLSDSISLLSRLQFTCTNLELYDFQLRNPNLDPLIKHLLRAYSGMFDHHVKIKEHQIARAVKATEQAVIKALKYLSTIKLVDFIQASNKPKLIFLKDRIHSDHLTVSYENYERRKEDLKSRIEAMANYLKNDKVCRNIQLLAYFGDDNGKKCGHCDVCLKSEVLNQTTIDVIDDNIERVISNKPISVHDLIAKLNPTNEKAFIQHINWLIETGKLSYDSKQMVKWNA